MDIEEFERSNFAILGHPGPGGTLQTVEVVPTPIEEGGYDIYIIAGQSNPRGNATIRAGIDDDYSGLQHVYAWDATTGTIIPARNPLPHQDIFTNGTGFWLEFVRGLPTNRKILIVPAAKGATGFGIHWNPGQPVYNETVSRANNAYASDPDNEIKAFLWHQGETDSANNNTGYLTALKNMRTSMIAAIDGLELTTPFIVGAIHEADAWDEYINTQLQQFAVDVDVAEYVDLTDLAVSDGTHFTAASLQTMGARYFAAISGGMVLLKREVFETESLAEKTWITHNSGNLNYIDIVDEDGKKYLRQNLNNDTATDPITGKLCDGNQTHTFLASNFYDPAVENHIVYEMDYRFDNSLWDTNVNDPYPIIAGKMFMPDVTYGVEGPYLGLRNSGTLVIVAQNGPIPWSDWTSRDYGWKTSGGAARNDIYLSAGTSVFVSDGALKSLRLEIQYNPGAIGYHKGRIFLDGILFTDATGINTDVDGWFNLPIEYEFRGTRVYVAGLDINDFQDYSTGPETYSGYAGGYEIKRYAVYKVEAA